LHSRPRPRCQATADWAIAKAFGIGRASVYRALEATRLVPVKPKPPALPGEMLLRRLNLMRVTLF
jgi:hypothetical protein